MSSFFFLFTLLLNVSFTVATTSFTDPSITIKNGTINGRYLAETWDQDLFLGIPYAQPPVGPLRFKRPQELTQPYQSPLNASSYGYSCYQFNTNFTLSEDCLTLNVIRPHNRTTSSTPLPVLVWIYGGGFFSGSSADPQYNLSGLVRTASEAQQPIIAVSLNYRVGLLGFFQTPEVFAAGDSNAGLLDQRLALRWIKENIAAFGGDPERITVWGESSGAQSIAYHLHSYDGRDDGLFQAAILESGGFVGTPMMPPAYYVAPVDSLARATGCGNAENRLDCLRGVDPEVLYGPNVTASYWNPIVDGDFLTDYPSVLAEQDKFIKVPLLVGANSDEGITFSPSVGQPNGPPSIDNATDILNILVNDYEFQGLLALPYQISPASARKLLELYPNDPAAEPPYDIKNDTIFPEKGLQWRRSAAMYGDIVMIAVRRKLCEEYNNADQKVFSYRFATRPWNAGQADGVQHFVNVVFSFQNISGALGPLPEFQSYQDLSTGIGKAYVNFVYEHDPNGSAGNDSTAVSIPHWTAWTKDEPVNMVLNATKSEMEADDFRKEGIAFLNSISRERLG